MLFQLQPPPSPYLKLAGSAGKFDWQAGIKYFNYKDPASEGFTTGAAPGYALVAAADLNRQELTYETWLPTVSVSYTISDNAQLYGSYGPEVVDNDWYRVTGCFYQNREKIGIIKQVIVSSLETPPDPPYPFENMRLQQSTFKQKSH